MEVIIIILLGILIYFIPTIIAVCREHQSAIPIFITNALLGWMFIGWAIALIWSFTETTKSIKHADDIEKLKAEIVELSKQH